MRSKRSGTGSEAPAGPVREQAGGALFVGALDEFPLNAVRLIDLRGRSVGVIRTADAVYAVRNVCPHQGAPVCRGTFGGTILPSAPGEKEYGLDNRVLRCPWHAWEFNVSTGAALFGISDKRLVTYSVELRQGGVFIDLRPGRNACNSGSPK